MIKVFNFKLKNRNGALLPFVLIVFVVLFILGIALLQVGMSDTMQATWQNNRVQAHYLARSGIEIGDDMLQTEIETIEYTSTLQELVDKLNTDKEAVYTVTDVGEFAIEFSITPLNEIKITATGNTDLATPQGSGIVTYTKKISKGVPFELAAEEWLHTNKFSFKPNVHPDEPDPDTGTYPSSESYLGKVAFLESAVNKSIANPSVGSPHNMSVFRASMINFGEYDGISIDASSNSYVGIDSEIAFFNGSIETKNNSFIQLHISDAVLNQRNTTDYNPSYPNPVDGWPLEFLVYEKENVDGVLELKGFESEMRYLAFINSFPGFSETHRFGGPYGFVDDVVYGVIKLGEINKGTTNLFAPTGKGYYYFPDGLRLDLDVNKVEDGVAYMGFEELIPIPDEDPITDILDTMFKWSYGLGKGVWNYQ